MPQVHTEEPRLPPDLERHIFETVALSRPVNIPNLMLVAWRVKSWVEPLLYRVLVMDMFAARPIDGLPFITADVFLRLVTEKSGRFFPDSVKHLILGYKAWGGAPTNSHRHMSAILSACSGVTHFSLQTEVNLRPHELTALAGLQAIHYLAVDISRVFASTTVDFTHPVFRHITHLELRNIRPEKLGDTTWVQVAHIPNLTHLSFRVQEFCGSLGCTLCASLRLTCLIFLCPRNEDILAAAETVDDPRFAVMKFWSHSICVNTQVEWQQMGLTGESYWSKADRFLEARRAGDIDGRLIGTFADSVYHIDVQDEA
ncbi:hypothetical protein DFH07DRAFT_780605 [Mycena maculata]|uniref:Uncharacterized protein n=1 Tax=Mycena maculata TaxID=230809 RepID=A0AAD7I278_9AGAR|nr:hypothetical protein DFH07DRAFT_780605 [Mycena maculata]